jgi:hypothetical protein
MNRYIGSSSSSLCSLLSAVNCQPLASEKAKS